MDWRKLFFAESWRRKPAAKAFGEGVPTGAGAPAKDDSSGTFITPGSLGTFAGATLAITLLTTFVELLRPAWKTGQPHVTVTVIIAVMVGALLFWVNSADKDRRPQSSAQWAMAAFVALVNTAYLSLASLGIPLAVNKPPTEQGPAAPKAPPAAR
jgi:hypothetical protein